MHNEDANNNSEPWMVDDDLTLVEEVCEQYVELYRADKAPSIDVFARKHPKIQAEILELLPTIIMMEGARSRSFEKRKDGSVTRGSEQIRELGDYQIVREIGRGGMGIVYEAKQKSLDRPVAVKLLPKHMLTDEQVAKFHREASTAAKLHHTNIAPIYGVGESKGFHFYAMQLLNGITLDRYVESSSTSIAAPLPPLSIEQVVEIGHQIAMALEYAHNQGVLHRDIKPSNLLLDPGGNVWMMDFGLAISRDDGEPDHAAGASGTLRYMAPEKFDEAVCNETGDIYSLGITLIELLSGQPAFSATRIGELSEEIQAGKIRPLLHRKRSLPRDLRAIFRKAISTDPLQRYQSAQAFAHDLKQFSETRPVSAKPDSSFSRTILWVKRNRALASACAIAATMLVTASVVSWCRTLMCRLLWMPSMSSAFERSILRHWRPWQWIECSINSRVAEACLTNNSNRTTHLHR